MNKREYYYIFFSFILSFYFDFVHSHSQSKLKWKKKRKIYILFLYFFVDSVSVRKTIIKQQEAPMYNTRDESKWMSEWRRSRRSSNFFSFLLFDSIISRWFYGCFILFFSLFSKEIVFAQSMFSRSNWSMNWFLVKSSYWIKCNEDKV